MSTVFLKILNISFTAGWLIIAVVAIRLLLKKAPKWVSCFLWALVALRLLIPFSIESALSLIPSAEVVSESITSNYSPSVDTGFVLVDDAVNPIITSTFAPKPELRTNPMETVVFVASIVWIVGMAVMLIYAIISFVILKKQVSAAIPLKVRISKKVRRVYVCDDIKSPFILGIFKPSIYVPSNLDKDTIHYVYAHENSHIRRRDYLWKPLGFILLSVYWFNPLCWLAYILLCKDIEAACDEKVINGKNKRYLASYSQALLDCSYQRKRISACPVAFGETGVKSRIKGILNYRKPAFWIILISFAAIIVVAICFMTNPKKKELKHMPPELSVALADTNKFKLADFCGFITEKEKPSVQEIELVSNGEIINIENRLSCLYADKTQDTIVLDFEEEPDEVNVRCFKEKGEGTDDYIYPEYDKKTHSISVPTETNYAYIVDAKWEDIGNAYFTFGIIRPEDSVAEETDKDEKSETTKESVMHISEIFTEEPDLDIVEKITEIPLAEPVEEILQETNQEAVDKPAENQGSEIAENTAEEPPKESSEKTGETENTDESLVKYEYVDGMYIVEGKTGYKYKKILYGKDPGAAGPGMFIVLTNDPDITYEKVSKSLYSSNSDDWLTDSVIITMNAMVNPFESFTVWPTSSTIITRGFDVNVHAETDIAGEFGDPIYSIADGTVIFADLDGKKGYSVKMFSDNALIEYNHLDSISVKPLDVVKAGDKIGEMGSTGASTGPHLGISLNVNGEPKDIMDYYSGN